MDFVMKSTNWCSSKFPPSSLEEVLSNWFDWKFFPNGDIWNNVIVVLLLKFVFMSSHLCIILSIEYPVVCLHKFIVVHIFTVCMKLCSRNSGKKICSCQEQRLTCEDQTLYKKWVYLIYWFMSTEKQVF